MRRPLLLLALLLFLALCGCDIFRASTFPSYLTMVSGYVGLGEDIPTPDAHAFTLSSVTTPLGDLVFLATSQPVAGTALFVMDENLNILQQFNMAQLVALHDDIAPLPNSPRAFLGVGGAVVILGLQGFPSSYGLTALARPGETPDAGSFGFANGASNVAGFSVFGDMLAHYIYTPWGSGAYRGNYPITGDTSMSFNIMDVRADPARTDAVLILDEMRNNRVYFIPIPQTDIVGPGIGFPITASYAYFTMDRFDTETVGYTQNGFIGLQWGNNGPSKFIRFDMTGALHPVSMEYPEPTDMQVSTRSAGGWFYIYDRKTRAVRRINAWW